MTDNIKIIEDGELIFELTEDEIIGDVEHNVLLEENIEELSNIVDKDNIIKCINLSGSLLLQDSAAEEAHKIQKATSEQDFETLLELRNSDNPPIESIIKDEYKLTKEDIDEL